MNKTILLFLILIIPGILHAQSELALPDEYALEDIQIIIRKYSAMGYGTTTITIDGKGEIHLSRIKNEVVVEEYRLKMEPRRMYGYLLPLFDMDFFRMPRSYPNGHRIPSLDGDTIRMNSFSVTSDISKYEVECKLGPYVKKVMTQRRVPEELREYVLETEADIREKIGERYPDRDRRLQD